MYSAEDLGWQYNPIPCPQLRSVKQHIYIVIMSLQKELNYDNPLYHTGTHYLSCISLSFGHTTITTMHVHQEQHSSDEMDHSTGELLLQ